MARLPIPGEDKGVWGAVLNDYLLVSHEADGTLRLGSIDVSGLGITKADIGLINVDNTADIAKPISVAQQNALNLKFNTSQVDTDPLLAANSDSRVSSQKAIKEYTAASYASLAGANEFTGLQDFSSATVVGLEPGPQGPPGLVWRGVYNGATTYARHDVVQIDGGAFIATAGVIGVSPGTSQAPNSPWELLAVGPQGVAGDGAVGVVSPADLAFKAWACDPLLLIPGTRTTLVAGQMNGVLLNVPSDTISGISFFVGVAGASLADTYIALIDAITGDRLAVTADVSSQLQSTGFKRIAFSSSFSNTSSLVYAVFLVGSGNTMPQLTKFPNTDTAFVNARGPGVPTGRIRVGQITTAFGLTSIPVTNDMSGSSAQNTGMWVALD